MWNVRLEDAKFNRINFTFECFGEAGDFVFQALSANKDIEASISIIDTNKLVEAVEEGEE